METNTNETEREIIAKAEREVTVFTAEAKTIVVKSEADNQIVANRIVEAREMLKKLEAEIMAPARETKRQATANVSNLERIFIKPVEEALTSLRNASAKFVAAEQARRDALQAKEDAKFDKAAEKAAATGKPLTVVPKVIAKVQAGGVSYRDVYFAEVMDIKALCAGIAAGTVDAAAIEPAMPFLNAIAKAHKTAGKEILPGVFCRSKKVVG